MGSLTQKMVALGLVFLLWNALGAPLASADSITLSVNTVREPPRDLLDPDGNPLDPGAAAQMPDLSLLNPSPDKRWQDRRYPIEDPAQGPLSWGYPTAAQGVRFVEHDRANTFTYTAKVQNPADPSRSFRLTLSRFVHATLMRAALMRLLGYYVPSPKLYRDLKLRFPSKEKMDEFITTAQGAMTSDFKSRGMIRALDDRNFILTVSEAVLEPNVPEVVDYFNFHWGFLPTVNAENAAAISGLLQQWGQSRAHRAMIGALILVDVPEAVNRYSSKAASTWAGTVILTHPSAGAFKATTFEDVRWLVRRMSTLSEADLRSIVNYAGFPAEVDDLVYAKLVHRFINLHEHFKLPVPKIARPALKFTGPAKIVVDGKVAKEYVDGHPERFSHGEREMPFENSDLWRYLSIEGLSTGAKKLFSKMTEKLQVKTTADLGNKRNEEIQQRIKDHVAKNPFEALYQEKETWGGPIGGINFDASRHLTTGTYFESQAPIQLVDNFSIGASLGYFRALDGIEGYFPAGGGNVTITRDYTHVRPLDTVKQGTSVSWMKLNVPGYMHGLGELLEEDPLSASDQPGKKKQYPLDKVLAELKKGEVFSVTDSIALNLFASFGTTFQFLLSKNPVSFLNTLSLGVDGGRVGLRQTTFTRTENGVQVYLRKQGTWQGGLTFDANYFLNLLRLRSSTQSSSIHTDAYLINYIPELSADLPATVDKAKKDATKQTLDMIRTKGNLRLALAALLKSNDSELLEANFPDRKPTLDHEIVTDQFAIKALTERRTSFTESHKLKLSFPAVTAEPAPSPSATPGVSLVPPAAPPGLSEPAVPEEVVTETSPTIKNEDVVLFGYKSGVLTGRDFIGTVFDAIEGFLKKTNVISRVDNPNPANSIFGRGYWKIINTEMDLSPIEKPYPPVGIIQNVWGGWHMARDSFLELLDEIQRRYPGAQMGVERIIENEAFTDTKSLDFYRVSANMTIFNEGLAKVRDLVLQPESARKDPRDTGPQSGLFAWLREAIKLGPKKESDEAFFRALMTLLGDGDYDIGKGRYLEQCQNIGAGGGSGEGENGRSGSTRWYGREYECMSDWLSELLSLRRNYPGQAEFLADAKAKQSDEIRQDQLRWLNRVIEVLEKRIPLSTLHAFVGEANAIFYVRINGFRTGDEDGDLEFFSNAPGDPTQDFEIADGIFNLYAKKTGISAVEVDRSQAPFR